MTGKSDGSNVRPLRRSKHALREWPLGLVLAGVAIGLILVAADYFRRGSLVLAASVLLAGCLRLVLPEASAGLLSVRSRTVDVTFLLFVGGLMVLFAVWVPSPG